MAGRDTVAPSWEELMKPIWSHGSVHRVSLSQSTILAGGTLGQLPQMFPHGALGRVTVTTSRNIPLKPRLPCP